MSVQQYAVFLKDVRENGIREPVTFWREETLIDGRHRVRAAEELGIEYPRRSYNGDDPVGMALSLNLARRHLDQSQRAMIASGVANLERGQRADYADASIEAFAAVSQSDAARMLNVSRSSVQRADRVRRDSPMMIPAVQQAMVALSTADHIARHAPDVVPRIAAAVERGDIVAVQALATEARQRARDAQPPTYVPTPEDLERSRLNPQMTSDELRRYYTVQRGCEQINELQMTPQQWAESLKAYLETSRSAARTKRQLIEAITPAAAWLNELIEELNR
jgi:ParB-like chromosome segregation protein Spo0J